MPHTQTKTVYNFDELSARAKDKARDWYRDGNLAYDWWESVYDDASRVGEILGVEFDARKKNNPKSPNVPCIWFSGFCSQGDGACFEGRYDSKNGVAAIREYAPLDTKLHEIADGLWDLQTAHGEQLSAFVKHRGHYYHSRCTDIEVTKDGYSVDAGLSDAVAELLRDFMTWIYRQLEKEHDYLQSDECVDESILANAYEFSESGSIA